MSSLLTELQTHPGRPPAEARPRFFAPVLQDYDGDAFRISHGYRALSAPHRERGLGCGIITGEVSDVLDGIVQQQ